MDKRREVAFYLDEAGPYLVKPQSGQKWYPRGKIYKVPDRWATKGKVFVFGALQTDAGKIYHHISDNKKYKTLRYFIHRLAITHKKMKKIYIVWDKAMSHITKALHKWIGQWNRSGKVKFKILPLPTYSPWLNPIEPVFGDLHRKIIAGSNFRWPCNMAQAIHKYFLQKNLKTSNP